MLQKRKLIFIEEFLGEKYWTLTEKNNAPFVANISPYNSKNLKGSENLISIISIITWFQLYLRETKTW